jgi:hypothetical protein
VARRLLPLVVVVLAAGGCGGGGAAPTTPIAPLVPRSTRPPALPSGWTRVVDRSQALSFGLPPGWRATRRAGSVQVRSADRALALTVAVDRRAGQATPGAYVEATLAALRGYDGLARRAARAVIDVPYPAASASATGTLRSTGVRQRIVAIGLAPSPGTIVTLLSFSSARAAAGRYVALLARLVRTVFVG